MCCDLYLSPESPLKSKTGKYTVVAKHFWSHSLFLFSISNTEFLENHLVLLPYSLPAPETAHWQLVKGILKEEFGHEISTQLLSPPYSETKNERQKQAHHENQTASVVDTCETQNTYIRSWPQVTPKDVVLECINVYHKATQLTLPPTCCICSRQQLGEEMHGVS